MKKTDLTMRQKIEALMNDETVSTYRIAKDTGVWTNSIVQVRKGNAEISNIRFDVAEKYAELYDIIQKEREQTKKENV